MTERPVHVLGAGGHAAVVVATLQDAGYTVAGVFDDARERWGSDVLGVPVIGALARAAELREVAAVIGIGDNRARRDIAEALTLPWISVVHPRAYVHPTVIVGEGTVVFAGAVIQPRTRLGSHVIVNTSASIDHDGVIEEFAHVAPGSHLSGAVRVGAGALLGVGSAVKPGGRVGAWSIVGAGAVVIAEVADQVTAVGVPARPIARSERA